MPHSELPQIAALVCAVITGVLTAELNGALHQWSSLKPPVVGDDGLTHPDHDENRVFRLALDTIITGLESRLAAAGDGARAPAIDLQS